MQDSNWSSYLLIRTTQYKNDIFGACHYDTYLSLQMLHGHLKRFGAVGAETDKNRKCAASEDLNNKQSISETLVDPDGKRVGHGLPWVVARHYSTYLSFQTLVRPP